MRSDGPIGLNRPDASAPSNPPQNAGNADSATSDSATSGSATSGSATSGSATSGSATSGSGASDSATSGAALSPAALALLKHPALSEAATLAALPADRFNALAAPQLRGGLEAIHRFRAHLDGELVRAGDFCPPGATRSVEEWRDERAALRELETFLGAKFTAELDQRGEGELTRAKEDLKRDLVRLLENGDAALVRILARVLPQDLIPYLRSSDSKNRLMCLFFWEPPSSSREQIAEFRAVIELEQEAPGRGLRLLSSGSIAKLADLGHDGKQSRKATDDRPRSPQPPGNSLVTRIDPKSALPESALARTRRALSRFFAAMGEDRFRLPRIWRGEFSPLKPKVTSRSEANPKIADPKITEPTVDSSPTQQDPQKNRRGAN